MSAIGDLRDQIAQGETPDYRRALALQAIDQALADERFAADAAARQEDADHAIDGHAG